MSRGNVKMTVELRGTPLVVTIDTRRAMVRSNDDRKERLAKTRKGALASAAAVLSVLVGDAGLDVDEAQKQYPTWVGFCGATAEEFEKSGAFKIDEFKSALAHVALYVDAKLHNLTWQDVLAVFNAKGGDA